MNEYGGEWRSRHHHNMGGWQETAIANLGKYLRLGTYDPEHEVKLLVCDHVPAERQVAVQPTPICASNAGRQTAGNEPYIRVAIKFIGPDN